MNIVVCIKAIPDPELPTTLFRVDEAAREIVEETGARAVMSPFDKQALEAALRMRDSGVEARIVLVCMGPDSARSVIKDGLALGADEAWLLSDDAFEGADGYTTVVSLVAAIRNIGDVDLVLTGRQAADGDAGVVGCGIAEALGWPAVTFAASIEVDPPAVVVERALEDGRETVEAPLPAVVTVSHELGEPRHPSLRETMRAARKPISPKTAADLGLDLGSVGAAGARQIRERLYIPVSDVACEFVDGESPAAKAEELIRRLREERAL